MGHSGTAISGGWVTRRDAKFTSLRAWIEFAERIMRTDPKLAGGWSMVSQTALAARWRWRAGDESDLAKRAADYANEAWFRRRRTAWEEDLGFLLDYLPYGVRYAEEMHYAADGRVWLSHYADRDPYAHDRWVRDGTTGQLVGVQQLTTTGQSGERIPASKLLVLWHKKKGDNFDGEGLLRPCAQLSLLADHVLDCMGIGMDRWAAPTPLITTDRDGARQAGYSDTEIDAMVTAARANARAYVSHASASLEQTPHITFGVYGQGAMDVDGPLRVLAYANQARLSAFLAHLMELGVESSGSRSIGLVHQSMLRRALTNVLDYIAGRVGGAPGAGRGTMGRLCRWNFPGIRDDQLPVLVHSGLDHDALAEALPHLPGLIAAGAMTPTDRLERELLLRVGLDWDPEASRPVAERLATRGVEGRPNEATPEQAAEPGLPTEELDALPA